MTISAKRWFKAGLATAVLLVGGWAQAGYLSGKTLKMEAPSGFTVDPAGGTALVNTGVEFRAQADSGDYAFDWDFDEDGKLTIFGRRHLNSLEALTLAGPLSFSFSDVLGQINDIVGITFLSASGIGLTYLELPQFERDGFVIDFARTVWYWREVDDPRIHFQIHFGPDASSDVPEPAAVLLAATALLGLGAQRRWRRVRQD